MKDLVLISNNGGYAILTVGDLSELKHLKLSDVIEYYHQQALMEGRKLEAIVFAFNPEVEDHFKKYDPTT